MLYRNAEGFAMSQRPQPNSPVLWRGFFPFPKAADHKYSRGHALIYGGEVMTGAARLAARAAQRIGAGIVTLACAEKSAPVYQQALESVIVRVVHDTDAWRALLDDTKRDAVLIGPGLGIGDREIALVNTALAARKPCVLDADGLTNFAGRFETLKPLLHERCVLTPHEGEFARLFDGLIDPAADKQSRALQAATTTGCIILLKGAETVIAAPDGSAILNDNAPPWLATAGSGDVLSGMILGLIAQKMPPLMAAAAAAWLHGKIAADFGPGLIAEDIVTGIPEALKKLQAI